MGGGAEAYARPMFTTCMNFLTFIAKSRSNEQVYACSVDHSFESILSSNVREKRIATLKVTKSKERKKNFCVKSVDNRRSNN